MDNKKSVKKPTHIFDLNDDCLTSIFNYLDGKSFFQLHVVHPRFHKPIQMALKNVCIQLEFQYGRTTETTLNQIEKFFAKHGNDIKSLAFSVQQFWHYPAYIDLLLRNYCANGNVKNCTFENIHILQQIVEKNPHFIEALQMLKIKKTQMDQSTIASILNAVGETTKLDFELHDLKQMTNIRPTHNITNLHFVANGIHDFTDDDIKDVPIIPTIKHLTLLANDRNYKILRKFPNIESLEISDLNDELDYMVQPIENLQKLKKLSYYGVAKNKMASIISQVSANLEELQLIWTEEGCDHLNIIELLCSISNLKILYLHTSVLFDASFVKLAQRLKNLQSFVFYGSFYGTTRNQEKIAEKNLCEFIRQAGQLRTLKYWMPNLDLKYVNKLYNNFVSVREKQNAEHLLYVVLFNQTQPAKCIYRNRWVKMRIMSHFDVSTLE